MTTDARKIIAGTLIAVLALSVVSIVTPAYSEHPANEHGKEKKGADEKAKGKNHEEEEKSKVKHQEKQNKDKAKEKVKEEKQKAKDKEEEQKTKAKEHAKEERKEAKDKAKSDVNHADMIEKFLSDLEHRASRLQKAAEEQSNHEALAVIEQAKDLIMKAKQMISEENHDGAKALLREANELLNKAERMLHGGSDTNTPPYVNHGDMIEKFVVELEHRASWLQKVAEDQGNNEALSLIQQAMDLIMKAKQMVSEKNYEEAKPLLREANDLLIKAEMMLKGGSDTNPAPGQEGQAPYHPPKPPVYGDIPGIAQIITLVGTGTATEAGGGETADVFAELDLSVFRATRHMLLLRVTDGFIAIGDVIYTVEHGKAVIATKAHKMILTARVSSDDGTETQKLKLFGTMQNSPDNIGNPQPEHGDNLPPAIHTIMLRGKLAQSFINMDAELI